MKKIITIISIFAICVFTLSAETYWSPEGASQAEALGIAQRATLTISSGNLTMRGLFDIIERETNYLFVFSEKDINMNEKIDVAEGSTTVAECLSEVFPEKGLSYYFEKNYIIITADEPDRISIYGKIVDERTKSPLSFASISVKGSKISNVSNGEGIFLLKFPQNHVGDTLLISYLGYDTKRIAIGELKFSESQKVFLNVISLKASSFDLQPITVRAADAQTIVEEAIEKIYENYPQNSMQMTAFYREMIKKNNTYVALTEAVLDVLKASYSNTFSMDQIGIYKGRGSIDRNRLDTLVIKYKGGINAACDLDIMKDPFLTVMPSSIGLAYDFVFDKPVILNDKVNYVILFNQKEGIDDILFRGKLYIDSENLALTRAEFNMNVEDNPKASALFVRSKPKGLTVKMLYAKYLVQYREINGKYTFDYSRTEIKFDSKWDRKLFKSPYTIISEMAVTDRSDRKIKIPSDQKVRSSDIALDKVSSFNDEDFWADYNIIEPESGIETIIARIIRQLKKRE